jgi:hypothetical protein
VSNYLLGYMMVMQVTQVCSYMSCPVLIVSCVSQYLHDLTQFYSSLAGTTLSLPRSLCERGPGLAAGYRSVKSVVGTGWQASH